MESTQPAFTTANQICNWNVSACTTMKPQVRNPSNPNSVVPHVPRSPALFYTSDPNLDADHLSAICNLYLYDQQPPRVCAKSRLRTPYSIANISPNNLPSVVQWSVMTTSFRRCVFAVSHFPDSWLLLPRYSWRTARPWPSATPLILRTVCIEAHATPRTLIDGHEFWTIAR